MTTLEVLKQARELISDEERFTVYRCPECGLVKAYIDGNGQCPNGGPHAIHSRKPARLEPIKAVSLDTAIAKLEEER